MEKAALHPLPIRRTVENSQTGSYEGVQLMSGWWVVETGNQLITLNKPNVSSCEKSGSPFILKRMAETGWVATETPIKIKV